MTNINTLCGSPACQHAHVGSASQQVVRIHADWKAASQRAIVEVYSFREDTAVKRIGRRSLIKKGSMLAGAAVALAPHSRVFGANDDLRVGVVGFGGQGGLHIRLLRELTGVRLVALCDADRAVLDRGLRQAKQRNESVNAYVDVRKLLDDKGIDAITTATPDHWHALVTVWACQAGKDVYVEKPLCHSLWEGRKMVEAARKYQRIVQFGLQDHGCRTGAMQLETVEAGKIRVVFTSLNRTRESIGKVSGPQPVPATVDYNLWAGPAPLDPLMRKNLHYDWHWVWPTGTGEIGNNGIYPLDACRWALGQSVLPKRAVSFGGRFLFNDDGQTPNSQIALFQYDPGPLVIFELRNLPPEKGPKTVDGKIKGDRGAAGLPHPSGRPGDTGGFSAHKGHLFNFIQTVRNRNRSNQRADVLEGHLSTAIVHMANISYRLGTPHSPDEIRHAILDRGPEAVEVFAGFQEHLAANGVDLSRTPTVLGPWLEMDSTSEQFVGSSELVTRANRLLKRPYREPFVIPDAV
jgi:predicted dehydrogenase